MSQEFNRYHKHLKGYVGALAQQMEQGLFPKEGRVLNLLSTLPDEEYPTFQVACNLATACQNEIWPELQDAYQLAAQLFLAKFEPEVRRKEFGTVMGRFSGSLSSSDYCSRSYYP